jgi:RNA polymerase sigma-70 factor, ECF subfamily
MSEVTQYPNEAEIVARFRAGDNEAGNELYNLYRTRIHALCYSMLHDSDSASDVLQETFFRLLKMRTKVDPSRSFGAFIHRMAYNLCIDAIRRRKSLKEYDDFSWLEDSMATDVDEDVVTDAKTHLDAILAGIDKLPTSAKMLVELRYRSALTPEQIGEVLDVPPSTIRVRLHRARKMLLGLISAKLNGPKGNVS